MAQTMGRQPVSNAPIGIFDSGVGGLTVARAVMERLPNEAIVYFGDTARVPYGVKSAQTIRRYAAEITRFLLQQEVKLLIIACNSMAAVAADTVAGLAAGVPVLDVIDAGARAAAEMTRRRAVAVIGTMATVDSGAYARRIHAYAPDVRVHAWACPLFVPLVEEGWVDHPVTEQVAREYLAPLTSEAVDTLVLGCTHYPLLKPLLRRVAGPDVALVDSAVAVAEAAAQVLAEQALLRREAAAPQHHFYVSDKPPRFHTLAERFLARSLPEVERVVLEG
ncbi:glutamate racemase [Hydrogenophilus thermoluteolus]|uniref:glutamate racemase n=1 Tax=Hydrogenophilus thermoluteolus TaxID=297 RepID=UPI003F66E4C5